MSVKANPFDYPQETRKRYHVFYTSYGFDCGYFEVVDAPNKTWARRFMVGKLDRGM